MGIGPSTKETSLHHFRDPLLEVVAEDTDLDLMGIMLVGSPDGNEDKMLVGTRAAVWAECMRADGVILSCETFLLGIEFGDVHLRVDISVFTLRGSHHCYELVHDLVEALVFRHGIDSRHRLTPFIHVSVMESRSVVFALNLSGSD